MEKWGEATERNYGVPGLVTGPHIVPSNKTGQKPPPWPHSNYQALGSLLLTMNCFNGICWTINLPHMEGWYVPQHFCMSSPCALRVKVDVPTVHSTASTWINFGDSYSYGPLPVISTYNPVYRMYNPTYNQL